jgi:CheY-like chemotaxis protein
MEITLPSGASRSNGPVVVYVEDDTTAALFFYEVIQQIFPYPRVIVLPDSEAALSYLKRSYLPNQFPDDEDGEAPCPDLVVLDLHLPGASGLELLQQLRDIDVCAPLRAVFLSTSIEAADREHALALGALEFIRKPRTLPEFEQTMRHIHDLACQNRNLSKSNASGM